MKKTIKRVLIVLGILLAAVLIYFGAQFLRLRAAMSRMTPEPIPAGEAVDEAIAATQAGQVRGYITDGIFSYRGIPYAEAKERFVPAQAVTPWEGVRDATEYGAASPQGAMELLAPGYEY